MVDYKKLQELGKILQGLLKAMSLQIWTLPSVLISFAGLEKLPVGDISDLQFPHL